MALGQFAFYEDSGKTTLVIASGNNFKSSGDRKDFQRGDFWRLTDGTLEKWNEENKYEEKLSLKNVSETDRNTLKTLYDTHDSFYYCPDTVNRSSEIYEVFWTGNYQEKYNSITRRYEIIIDLKEK